MTSPYRSRTGDPQPMARGGEIAIVAIGAVALGVGFAALAGLGLAAALFGGGWVWPHGSDTISHTLAGLLAGHPGRGLPAAEAVRVPGRTGVYSCVALCELLMIAAAITIGVFVSRYRRPGDARGGMATRFEAAQVLGARRLRELRPQLRPDLHPSKHKDQHKGLQRDHR